MRTIPSLLCLILLLAPSSALAEEWPDWPSAKQLHPGIRLAQTTLSSPRPMHVHAVKIDLRTPRLRLCTTPRVQNWQENKTETLRQTTREFLSASRNSDKPIVFAVNADAFSPWPAPWNKSTPSDLSGLSVSDGVVVSPPSGSPSLLITKSGAASIAPTDPRTKLDDVDEAVSGFALCLRDGQPEPSGDDLHPRTGIGLSQDGHQLFIIAIDGRRHSSQGATTHELGEWMKRCGADDAINMDGGGSTTLAWWNPDSREALLINSPVGSGLKFESPEADRAYFPTERANGNNLGIYFEPESKSP